LFRSEYSTENGSYFGDVPKTAWVKPFRITGGKCSVRGGVHNLWIISVQGAEEGKKKIISNDLNMLFSRKETSGFYEDHDHLSRRPGESGKSEIGDEWSTNRRRGWRPDAPEGVGSTARERGTRTVSCPRKGFRRNRYTIMGIKGEALWRRRHSPLHPYTLSIRPGSAPPHPAGKGRGEAFRAAGRGCRRHGPASRRPEKTNCAGIGGVHMPARPGPGQEPGVGGQIVRCRTRSSRNSRGPPRELHFGQADQRWFFPP
jgi:hypothetical protein